VLLGLSLFLPALRVGVLVASTAFLLRRSRTLTRFLAYATRSSALLRLFSCRRHVRRRSQQDQSYEGGEQTIPIRLDLDHA
jgi:hypothetical protein